MNDWLFGETLRKPARFVSTIATSKVSVRLGLSEIFMDPTKTKGGITVARFDRMMGGPAPALATSTSEIVLLATSGHL